MMAGGQEYSAQPPVMPTQLFGPMVSYAGSSLVAVSNVLHQEIADLQMNKGRSDDYTCAKVSRKEVNLYRDS